MRKGTIILLSICFAYLLAGAQTNLVPNPSFETMSSCPTGISQLNNAIPWYDPTSTTSDYFNQCATGFVDVPNNVFGTEAAQVGFAYAGFYTFNAAIPNRREYIQVKLNDTLAAGKKYLVSFYVSLADTMKYATSNLGAFFSPTPVSNMGPGEVLSYLPQIFNPPSNPLLSKNGWSQITDTLFSAGGELYITIGNFQDDSNSDTIFVGGNGWNTSYYYIDDVSVVDIGWVGMDEVTDKIKANLFPNPSNGEMTLEYFLPENSTGSFIIRDVTGKLISSYTLLAGENQLDIQESNLPNGVYLYEILQDGKTVKTEKLVVTK
ncbi:MAG: T9SS type A sorting domain-containing protein [Bacteroidia bacterium]|nr:T9SS type A sorting domain-containing protein [Bacteroidia bacterium]